MFDHAGGPAIGGLGNLLIAACDGMVEPITPVKIGWANKKAADTMGVSAAASDRTQAY